MYKIYLGTFANFETMYNICDCKFYKMFLHITIYFMCVTINTIKFLLLFASKF